MATRIKRSTSIPRAANMRRMCRFRPSSRIISTQEFFFPACKTGACTARSTSFPSRTPCFYSAYRFVICDYRYLHAVSLRNARRRRRDLSRPFRIVGEQQQTFTSLVEAAHRGHPRQLGIEQCVHYRTVLLVGNGDDQTSRPVHHEVDLVGLLNRLTVHRDLITMHHGIFRIPTRTERISRSPCEREQ
jgi:hypothetical protein